MNLLGLLKRVELFAHDNAPAILTAIGVTGTLTTAYLTGKASVLAYERLQEHAWRDPEDRRELVEMVWKFYIPPAISAGLTITAIIYANRISANRATAMAAAYSLSEKAYREYREKVRENVGEKEEQRYRDEIQQERVDRNPPHSTEVVFTSDENLVLCYEAHTGRYFKSTMEALRKAENDINFQIHQDGYASLSDFYYLIGLDITRYSQEVGWNTDHPLKLQFTSVLTDEGKPCLAVDFDLHPRRRYEYFTP